MLFVYSFLSVLGVSLIAFVGLFSFSLKPDSLKKFLLYMVSFSAGGLLGDAFIHLLPEAIKAEGFTLRISLSVLLGILVMLFAEKIIHWRHCHAPECEKHRIKPLAIMNLWGDGIHNFIDGLIIGASFLVSLPVGLATTLAVILHEIPQEIGDFGVLLYGGFSRAKALFFNFLFALTAFLGMFLAFFWGIGSVSFLLPLAAGGFIYIAGSDLIPELHKEVGFKKSIFQLAFFSFGILVMLLLTFFD